jgi:thiamine-phosphate pyrophosphorylase
MNGPIVCYVSDRKSLPGQGRQSDVLDKIRTAAAARVDWIQIREKDLRASDLLELSREAVRSVPLANSNARVLVNDRLDIALSAGASGIHLGNESVPAREVVRWCRRGNTPSGFLLGVSCHRLNEIQEAEIAGADYVFFGPIFDTPSKRAFGTPHGIAELGAIARAVQIPVIAIGGINEGNAMECISAGAAGIAAIRLFQEPRESAELLESIAALHRLPLH